MPYQAGLCLRQMHTRRIRGKNFSLQLCPRRLHTMTMMHCLVWVQTKLDSKSGCNQCVSLTFARWPVRHSHFAATSLYLTLAFCEVRHSHLAATSLSLTLAFCEVRHSHLAVSSLSFASARSPFLILPSQVCLQSSSIYAKRKTHKQKKNAVNVFCRHVIK